MALFLLLNVMQIYALKTTTTTCLNEPLVFKLDIRERISNLGENYTIGNLDPEQICNETQQYDYIWLTQLWIPSIYNFDNTYSPLQANNYRELQNIKEYDFDPQLGTKQQLFQFIQGVKQFCYHIKILGEFSFYIGQDSSLMMNRTRFLQRPNSISLNEQNARYDDKGFVWATNSQGKTIPYTGVWNYFQLSPLLDIQDIIYNQILNNYYLDGIVFLQPSLGLYRIANFYYQQEIYAYGDSTMYFDFYQNIGIKYNQSNYYFMGDTDNFILKPLLLSAGLRQIYGLPPRSNTWVQVNYTFDHNLHNQFMVVSDLTATYIRPIAGKGFPNAVVAQSLVVDQQQCITFNFSNATKGNAGTSAGLGNLNSLKNINYLQGYNSAQYGLNAINAGQVLTIYAGIEPRTGFKINDHDKIQIQYDDLDQNMIFTKLESSLTRQFMIANLNTQINRFAVGLNANNTQISIAFPFYFTQNLISKLLQITGERHIQSIQNSNYLEIAQVLQSVNQYEDKTTLNMLALNIPEQKIIAVGICNKDLINYNQNQIIHNINSGAYLLQSDGYLIHSTLYQYNQQIEGYQQQDLLSITFIKSNYSIIFSKNNKYLYSIPLGIFVKNLNFCVGLKSQWSSVSLEY